MSFLDDAVRPQQKADLAAFLAEATAGRPARRAPLAAIPRPPPDRAGAPAMAVAPPLPEPALQAPLRDPWVPARRAPER